MSEELLEQDSTTEVVESTEAQSDSQPTNAEPDVTPDDQEAEMRAAYEKATSKKWKDEASQPEDEDDQDDKAKAEVKDEPVKVELSDKARKQVAELGIAEDDALNKAITAFERQRFDEEEIERRLSKGEARFIEDGLALASQQKQVDSLFGKVGQLEKKSKDPEQARTDGPLPADLKAKLDEVLGTIAEDGLLEDHVPALGIAFTTVSQHYEDKLKASRQEIDQIKSEFDNQIIELGYLKVEAEIEKQRASLTSKYGQLKDDAANDKVLKMYDTFVLSGQYADKKPSEIYAEAADAVLGKESATSFADALAKKHLNRKMAQPNLPINKAPSVASMTEEQKQRMVYDKIVRESRRGH